MKNKKQKIYINLSEEMALGVYSNISVINKSNAEFS